MKHKMNLQHEPFVKIKAKTKTIEMRLFDKKRSEISFADVKITVPNWQIGLSHSQNIATINFALGGSFDRLTGKAVMTSTVSLPSGVVLWNYANKYSCVQFDYSAYWYINNGPANFYDSSKTGSGALVWQPAKLY